MRVWQRQGVAMVRAARTGVVVAVGALVGALFTVVPAAAQARDVPATERNGNLTGRPPGLPAAGTPAARQLESARVKQDLDAERISATVVLKAAPAAATDSWMVLGFGHVNSDGACREHHEVITRTVSTTDGFSRSGDTLTLDTQLDMAGYMDWDCAFVALYPPTTGSEPYDALVGGLTSTAAKPKLKLDEIEVLGKDRKKVRLVRNTWTPVTVTVQNNGKVDALGVKIASGNKAFKVRKGKVGKVWKNGGRTSARIEVRLVSKAKRPTLRLVARNNQARAVATRNVVRVAKPRRPVAGKYRANKGRITFSINKKGQVTNFRAKGVQMVCQPPLGYASYQRVTVAYPRKAKVRPNGILDVQMRWEKGSAWYNTGLQMRVAGKKITEGRYTYSTANYCRVSENFKPKRR